MKKIIFTLLIIFLISLQGFSQKQKQETVLKREVTLYNPYKPSLSEVMKKSFLPDMSDTSTVRQAFKYDLVSQPFQPSYTISPIKPASIIPDPLSKLYRSYINFGLGNYLTPLAEVSITNDRSKSGAIGIYARHFSTNGYVKLLNDQKGFAGYMDNDVSLYGKKFLENSILNGSLDFSQKMRYAYGYDTIFKSYDPDKKDIRLNYYNTGANIGLVSSKSDSSKLFYDFKLSYNFFYHTPTLYQHNVDLKGLMAKEYKGFYVGSGVEFDYFSFSDSTYANPRYIASLSPFVKKSTQEWSLKLGFQALIDRGISDNAKFHIYPDFNFTFSIIPSYINFFADLSGKLVKNEPLNVIRENPYFFPDSTLFKLKNTDYSLVVKAGFKGGTGIDGNYELSASYSIVNDMLFFTNHERGWPLTVRRGNFFIPLYDDCEVLNIHGEIGGRIAENLSFNTEANWYRYTLTKYEFAWNKPDWDASLGLRYNLKNKIIAGVDFQALGNRNLAVTTEEVNMSGVSIFTNKAISMPAYFNINLSAEYRYTKILSFWVKLNNIGFNKYYEWAYYPSQRFIGMVGFTYSL
jgi:hypothetical protein